MHGAPVLLPTLVHGLHVAARGAAQKWLCSDRYSTVPAVLADEAAETVTVS